MKIGDILLNEWASENNPLRKSIITKVDGNKITSVYVYKSRMCTAHFVMDSESASKFKVIGYANIKRYIKDEIQNCKEEA